MGLLEIFVLRVIFVIKVVLMLLHARWGLMDKPWERQVKNKDAFHVLNECFVARTVYLLHQEYVILDFIVHLDNPLVLHQILFALLDIIAPQGALSQYAVHLAHTKTRVVKVSVLTVLQGISVTIQTMQLYSLMIPFVPRDITVLAELSMLSSFLVLKGHTTISPGYLTLTCVHLVLLDHTVTDLL